MRNRSWIFIVFVMMGSALFAQWPSGGGRGGMNMNMGRFYGKVVDSTTGKGIEFAVIQLFGSKWDTAAKALKRGMIEGQLSKGNGDFSLENLPMFGEFTLKISALGYVPVEQKVSFNMNMDGMKGQRGGQQDMSNLNSMSRALNAIDKDLGNIKLKPDVKNLQTVTVVDETPVFEMKLDKKVFNVEKNITATGGTAEDVLKNVPSVNVDIDGNVQLRNATPQIFVDGKPTTLSIDQIPADAIQSIEVITNPSSKYEASGGQAGIINIVLKKARKIGYNGNLRAGIDSRGRFNGGADINSREGKINIFASAFINQRKSHSTGFTERTNLIMDTARTKMFQESESWTDGFFGFGRLGFDYFIDNRNTITVSGNYATGGFKPEDVQKNRTDSLFSVTGVSTFYERKSNMERNFGNLGTAIQYKHLFPKNGEELTADVYYNKMDNDGGGMFKTQYQLDGITPVGPVISQKQDGFGKNEFITFQMDYVRPLSEKMKIETGARGSVKYFENVNKNYMLNPFTQEFMLIKSQNSNYNFTDNVYALYMSFSHQVKKLSYQVGLRGESSVYHGELPDSNQVFDNQYPISLFPSAFMTYQVGEKSDLQLSYSRRVNRPSFFNLIPFTDYSDSLNLSRGNPGLKPEFTHSLELSYLKTYGKGNNILVSAYYKNSTDLITRYQTNEYDAFFGKNVLINTYENADMSYAYGLEFTIKNSLKKWLEVMLNLNAYNAVINAENLEKALTNEQFTYFAKTNITFKLPKDFNIQITADYRSKMAMSAGGSGGGGSWGGGGGGGRGGMMMGGGGGWHGGSSSTTQGYVEPNYGVDLGLKKEFLKNKQLSVTLNVNDIFKTKKHETYTESAYFTQTTSRLRDAQVVRLSVNYRFGKFDVSIFKRKNNNFNMEGVQDMGGGG